MADTVQRVRGLAKDAVRDVWYPEWVVPIKAMITATIKDGAPDAAKLHSAVDVMFKEAHRKVLAGMAGPEVFRQLIADMAREILDVDLIQASSGLGSFTVAEGTYVKYWLQSIKSMVTSLHPLGDGYAPQLSFVVSAVGASFHRQFATVHVALPFIFQRACNSLDEFWASLEYLRVSNVRATKPHTLIVPRPVLPVVSSPTPQANQVMTVTGGRPKLDAVEAEWFTTHAVSGSKRPKIHLMATKDPQEAFEQRKIAGPVCLNCSASDHFVMNCPSPFTNTTNFLNTELDENGESGKPDSKWRRLQQRMRSYRAKKKGE